MVALSGVIINIKNIQFVLSHIMEGNRGRVYRDQTMGIYRPPVGS